jgi:hypothetical protein
MSYDIYIGEAALDVPSAEDRNESWGNYLNVSVAPLTLPEAPSFPGDGPGHENHRHPGYGQWSEFLQRVGLYELFFESDSGLMRRHPGASLLRQSDADAIRAALDRWRSIHPGTVPGWCECVGCRPYRRPEAEAPPHDANLDPNLARLIWLDWWVGWALANCKVPAIRNH